MTTLLEELKRNLIIDTLKRSSSEGVNLIKFFSDIEEDVIQSVTRKFVYDMLKEKSLNNPHADPLHKLLFSHIHSKEQKKAVQLYKSITISPPDGFFKKESIVSLLSKLFHKTWIQKYEYCVEQRGQTEAELGKGIHVHALVQLRATKSKAHIIRELSSSLSIPKQCIDIDTAYTPDGFRQYMRGVKNDPKKQPAVELNPQFRQNWSLKDIYGNFDSP